MNDNIIYNAPISLGSEFRLGPAQGGVFVTVQGAGWRIDTPIFISPHYTLDAPKCTYMIFRAFPIILRNPHDHIYKTPFVGDLQS